MTLPPATWMRRPSASGFLRQTAVTGMVRALGALMTFLILAIGCAVAVVFAATLLVSVTLATALLALSALASRTRPSPSLAHAPGGHAWVAYSWDWAGR